MATNSPPPEYVTMETLDAMFSRFTVSMTENMRNNIAVLEQRLSNKIEEARSRPSSPAPQMTPQQSIQPPQHQSIPSSQSEDKRWRPEEIGEFDGDGDVYAFTDRMATIAETKGVKLVQANVSTLFKKKAFKWWQYEVPDHIKFALRTNLSINPWIKALHDRFGPDHTQLMSELDTTRYTRKDAANKKDATEYVQEIMRITKGLHWPDKDCLITAYRNFEPGLQRDLDPPSNGDLTSFIKQVQLRQQQWHQVYSGFGLKQRPPDPPPMRPPYQSKNPYQQRPQSQYQQRPPQLPQQAQQTRLQQAYYTEEDDQNDWVYDPPTDTYHVASAYPATHGPGHTPRRYGNTHDGDYGTEAMANWTAAGESHRCSHGGCTHYHDH